MLLNSPTDHNMCDDSHNYNIASYMRKFLFFFFYVVDNNIVPWSIEGYHVMHIYRYNTYIIHYNLLTMHTSA